MTGLSPASVPAGSEAFTLTVRGEGFGNDAVVLWNGAPRPTTWIGDSEIRAEIAPLDVWEAGAVQVTVAHRSGGLGSAPRTFTVTPSGVATVAVWPATLALDPDELAQLEVTLLSATESPVPGRHVAYVSMNGSVASVFGDGTVKGGRPGTTNIRVATGEAYALVPVTVNPFPVHRVTIDPHPGALLVG